MRLWVINTRLWKSALSRTLSSVKYSLGVMSSVAFALSLNGCRGNYNLDAGNIGVNVTVASGDKQIANVNTLYQSTLSIRVTDSTTDEPVKYIPVTFSQKTNTDAIVLRLTATTDEFGIASTQVRSASTFNQTSIIRAQISGTENGAEFTLKTADTGLGYQFIADTTHNNIETAGVPFGFIIKIVDEQGNVLNTINDSRTIYWSFKAANSWFGSTAPKLPSAAYVCTFTAGICQTEETYYLTDSLQDTKFSVGDGPGGLNDVYQKPVTVISGSISKLAISTQPGGPKGVDGVLGNSDDGSALSAALTMTADAPTQKYYAAETDSVGNYIQDVTSGVTWQTTNESPASSILPYLTQLNSYSIQFVPTKRGSATITLSKTDRTSASTSIYINPGTPTQVTVNTDRSLAGLPELPANLSTLKFTVRDQKGNIIVRNYDGSGGFTGVFNMNITLNNAQSGPAVGYGCPRVLLLVGNWSGDEFGGTWCLTRTISQTFFEGESADIYGVRFTDATSVSPSISASLIGAPLWPNLTGNSGVLSISVGPPSRIDVYSKNDGTGNLVCSPSISHGFGFSYPCKTLTAGSSAIDMYAAVVDAGGNVINFPTNTTWTGVGGLAAQVFPQPSNPTNYAKLIPVSQAISYFNVTDSTSGMSTNWYININPAGLHHFNVIANDGLNSTNTVSVLRNFTLTVQALDAYNNVVQNYNGAKNINITTTFVNPASTSSPLGTAAVIPPSGMQSYTFVGGVLQITGLRLPNYNNDVTFQVTDGTYSSSTLSVQLKAGAPTAIKIRDSFGGAGSVVSGTSFSVDTDTTKTYYSATYDAENNYLSAPATSSWTWNPTGGASVSVTTPGPSTTFIPSSTGTGTLSVLDTASGLSATTSTVTILPGAPDYVSISATSSQTVGVPFNVDVGIKDQKGNFVNTINGSVNLNIAVASPSTTVYGYSFTGPTSGNFTFANGQISTPMSFTFYSIATSPQLIITHVTSGKNGNKTFNISNNVLDHLVLNRPSGVTSMLAGSNLNYSLYALDFWGNPQTTGPGATSPVTFSFSSALSGQDINQTDLTGPSSIAGASDLSVTGNLTSGTAQIRVTATQTGTLSATASVAAGGPTPTQNRANSFQSVTVNPDTTVDSVGWLPAPTTPYTASASTPMILFKAALKDVYGNVITTNPGDAIVLSKTGGTGALGGTLSQNAVLGVSSYTDIIYPTGNENITLVATHTNSGKSVSQAINVNPGAASQAIIILPCQTYNGSGSSLATAVTGTPFSCAPWNTTPLTAGNSFSVEMRAVDSGYNTVTTYNAGNASVIEHTSSSVADANFVAPALGSFTSGVRTMTVTVTSAGSGFKIVPNTGLGSNIASSPFNVLPGTASKIILVMPGETLNQGSTTLGNARKNTPNQINAGTSFNVTAYSVDNYYNMVSDNSTSVTINSTSDSFWNLPLATQTLSDGVATFSATMYKAQTTATITASSSYGTNLATNNFTIKALTATQAVAVLPNQTLNGGAPNLAAAITGTPFNSTWVGAGTSFNVDVYAVDQYYNRVTTYSGSSTVTTVDPNDTEPASAAFSTGKVTLAVNNVTADQTSSYTVTPTSALTNVTSSVYNIVPGTTVRTLVLLPNQTLNPGHVFSSGVTGTPFSGSWPTAGTSFTATIVATDSWSNQTTATTSVGFTSSDANTTFTPVGNQSLSSGSISFTVNTYKSGSITLTPTNSGGLTNTVSTAYTVNPSTATHIAYSTQPGGGPAGAAWSTQPAVEVQDAYNNRVTTGADSTVSISVALTSGTGTLSGTTSKTAVAGLADFSGSGLNIEIAGTGKVLTASTTIGAGAVTATSNSFTVTSNVGTQLVFTTQPGGGTAGSAWSTQPVVEIRDTHGNLVTSGADSTATVTMTLTTGTGALSGTVSKAAVGGIADFSGNNLSVNLVGTDKVITATATLNSVSRNAASNAFTITTGTASQLAFTTQPGGGTAGAAWSTQPIVEIRDSQGNPITSGADSTATVTLTLTTGTGTLSGTTSKAAVAGIANFAGNGLSIELTGSNKVLTATATLNSVSRTETSSAFTITPAAASQFTLSGAGSVIIGNTYSLTATAKDAFGNIATNYTGTAHLTSTDPIAVLPANYTFVAGDNGVKTFSTIELKTAGSQTVTVTDTVTGSITATSSSITVQNPALLTISDGATYDFGDVVRNTTYSKDHAFTIQNTGDVQATGISGAALSAPYSYKGGTYPGTGGNCGSTLNAGSSCSIYIHFAPTASSTYSDTLTLNYTNGVGSTSSQRAITGLGVAIAQIANGLNHSCARFDTGKVKCWGSNSYGQLGNGSTGNGGNTADSASPVAVSGITTAYSIVAGDYHTCALLSNQSVKCWGRNNLGQLGNGNNTDQSSAVSTDLGGSTASAITTGGSHTCAVLSGGESGQMKCWGNNSNGQLAISTATTDTNTGGTAFLTNVSAISTGTNHTCALISDGTLKCWGANSNGQLGDGTTTDSSSPVTVGSISTATKVSAGGNHSCAVLFDSGLSQYTGQCWGAGTSYQLGNGIASDSSSGVAVGALTTVGSMSNGSQHTCLTLSSGAVRCFGANASGQIGDGTTNNNSDTTVDIIASGVSMVSAGGSHSCALLSNNSIKCWGSNSNGQLGNSDLGTTQINTPNLIPSGL